MSSKPNRSDSQKTSGLPDYLEEMTEQTEDVMAAARREVDQARATLHDQLLPPADSRLDVHDEDEETSEKQDAPRDRGDKGRH